MYACRKQRRCVERSAQAGVTLIDTLVGTALMLVVFMGIAGAFQLTVEVVSNSKARAGAIALANERMEFLKSLSYSQIGVTGGIPAGIVPQIETVALNGISYTRRTLVYYADDPADGSAGADSNGIIADYKAIRVEISWASQNGERSIQVVGRMSPSGVETAVTGGVLTINVVNADNLPLQNAQVDILNTSTSPTISIRTYTNESGSITFIGAPAASEYQVVVSKIGYSTAQTYPVSGTNVNPNPRHLTVSNDQTTSYTFAIDVLASKSIQTFKAIEEREWEHSLSAGTSVATTSNTEITGGGVVLAGSPYSPSGFVQSTDITTALLAGWRTLSWSDTTPLATDIRYSIYHDVSGSFELIPDSDLPGNAAGFTDSSVDLTDLATSTYPTIRVGATLTSADPSVTPTISTWAVSYGYGPEVFPNLAVTLRGLKTIGNSPTVYKYDQSHTSDASGLVSIPSIEWDSYTLDVAASSGFETAEVCAPQPELLSPGASQTTRLYVAPATLKSLIVDVRTDDGLYIQDASVELTSSTTNSTLYSSSCGQVYYPSLDGGPGYTLNVSKSGFVTASTTLTIIGDTRTSVILVP